MFYASESVSLLRTVFQNMLFCIMFFTSEISVNSFKPQVCYLATACFGQPATKYCKESLDISIEKMLQTNTLTLLQNFYFFPAKYFIKFSLLSIFTIFSFYHF